VSADSWQEYNATIASAANRGELVSVAEPDARSFCEALLRASGVSAEDAALTTDVFIQSDLRGEDSHGMRLLLHVNRRIREGGDRAETNVTVVSDRGAMALLDANRSLGQVVAAHAMRLAMSKARKFGIGIVGVRNANSYTSAKYYPLMAVAEGMIGITYANSGVRLVAPHGGATPVVGTNPVSIAAPAGDEYPFVLDMAVSTAMERVFQAHERQEPLPSGWGLDREGNESHDAAEVLRSRTLMPWGGYKGFGLGLAHEMLTAILMGGPLFGGGATGFIPYDGPMNVSQHFQAISIEHFVPVDDFKRTMDQALRTVKEVRLRPGFSGVAYPGENGFREHERRLRDGIPMQKRVVAELNDLASANDVPHLRVLESTSAVRNVPS
jgi:LDH2 family malate/lactate/ureidoglycolate dehydrogenase